MLILSPTTELWLPKPDLWIPDRKIHKPSIQERGWLERGWPALPMQAAISLLASGEGVAGGSGESVTSDMDSTGASLIVVGVTGIGLSFTDITDSATNTWTELTNVEGGGNADAFMSYVVSPTTSATHNFTFTEANSFATIGALVFGGANTSQTPVESDATHTTAASAQAGSVTPGDDNSVIVQLLSQGGTISSLAIDSSYILELERNWSSGVNMGLAMAYLIQGTAAATNPTWSWTTNASGGQSAATFAPAAAAGGFTPRSYPRGASRGVMRGAA